MAATGTKVLHNFSRHDLESYCRLRRRRERFAEILNHHDRASLAAEALEILATVVFVLAGGIWLFRPTGGGLAADWLSVLAAVGVVTLVVLSIHLWIPWAIVRVWSAPLLFHTWWLWQIISRLFWPLTVGVRIVDALARRLADQPEEPDNEEEAFEDEIRTIVTAGMRDGLLEADAGEMIEGVIELGDADVSDVMTPRSEVDAIDVELPWDELQQHVIKVGRTRIPVYENSLDNVIGVLYVKDLLPELSKPAGGATSRTAKDHPQAWSVPNTKRLDELLQEFLRTRNHLAIVRDEYEAVAGVVTIEDVLEEIVGEIVDEWDEEEVDGIELVSETVAEVMGPRPSRRAQRTSRRRPCPNPTISTRSPATSSTNSATFPRTARRSPQATCASPCSKPPAAASSGCASSCSAMHSARVRRIAARTIVCCFTGLCYPTPAGLLRQLSASRL